MKQLVVKQVVTCLAANRSLTDTDPVSKRQRRLLTAPTPRGRKFLVLLVSTAPILRLGAAR